VKELVAEYKPRLFELTKISAPIIVEQIFMTVMGMVITAMVSSVGDYAVGAVGFMDNISNLMIALFAALTTGGAIVVAHHFGRQDRIGASKAGAQSVLLAFSLSLVIFVIFAVLRREIITALFGKSELDVLNAAMQYFSIIIISYPFLAVNETLYGVMRGCGDTGSPMVITLSMNVLNLMLGYILITGIHIFGIHTPGFGVTGAAVALTITRFCGMAASALYIVFKCKVVRLNKLSYFKPDLSIWKNVLGLGLPTSFESSLFQVGRFITQVFIVNMGAAALAANTVAGAITGFINVPGNALCLGVMILVGQRIGRGQVSDVKKITVFGTVVGAFMMGVICFICIPLIGAFTSIYNLSPAAADMFKIVLLVNLIVTPFLWAPAFIPPASLRATGDVIFTMVIAIVSMGVFRVVSAYVLGVVLGMGVLGVWIGMYIDWLVRSAVFLWRLLGNGWGRRLERARNATTGS